MKKNNYKELDLRIKAIEERFGNMVYQTKSVVQSEFANSTRIPIQEETLHGIYLAFCVETIDPWKMNRIRFFCPFLHNPEKPIKELPWAMPISSMGGFDDCGLNWVPPAGSTVALLFENGDRGSPFYLGTIWHRDRGPEGNHNWLYSSISSAGSEYADVYEGKRKGYLVGANNESQVLPPWNTESYNGFDINSAVDFSNDVNARKRITYPNIYGFKTPEKHMFKMVDGDAKCNRKWKRLEIMSSCGNWMCFKDDHIHYGGQWAHTSCGSTPGDVSCVEGQDEGSPEDDLTRKFGLISNKQEDEDPSTISENILPENNSAESALSYNPKEKLWCQGKQSNPKIIGGHPSTGHPNSKHSKSQVGDNPYFKHENECRPYKGPKTPQNNKCDLPQSGIQFMSISGHTFVMDDSVEEPSGEMGWKKSTESFNFGCNNNYTGRSYWKSATGHSIELSDVEVPGSDSATRGEDNYIKILSATGNKIELNDHTIEKTCVAGEKRGIHIESTSKHSIDLCDDGNEQCSPQRKEGGKIDNKSKNAYVRIRSGYGLEINMNDFKSQQETQRQYISIKNPQRNNKGGPHLMRMQGSATPSGSFILLRSGGNYIVSTYGSKADIIGDPERNPSDYIELISRQKLVKTEDYYINITKKSHIFLADEKIFLLAGKDCSPPPNQEGESSGCVPCAGPVLVYMNGCIRLSDRVYASSSCSAQAASIFMMEPLVQCPAQPCC